MAFSKKLADLFYEVRAKTSGFEADLKSAEKSAEKLGAYIKAHPVAAAGALGAALLGVAIQAKQMAAEVEKGLKVVEQTVPGATGRMQELRSEIRGMSLAGPHSQAELASAAAAIGRQGVASLEELQARLEAAKRAADATGADMATIIGGMDLTFDLFGESVGSAEDAMQTLWAAARGRAPLEDMFAALQGAAPTIQDLKLDFETAARALGGLMDRGLNAKQAGAELKQYGQLGAEGAAAIQQLAKAHVAAADARDAYNAAVNAGREGEDASWKTLKNNFSAVLIDLGQKILPMVTAEMRGLLSILSLFNGELDRMLAKPDLRQLASIGSLPERIRANARVSNSPLRKEMYEVANRARERANEGTLDLGGFSVTELENMKKAVDAYTGGVEASVKAFDPLVDQITEAIAATQRLQEAEKVGAQNGAQAVLTAEQIKKSQEARAAAIGRQLEADEKVVAQALKVAGLLGRAASDGMREWEDANKRVAQSLGDLEMQAQAYIARILGDTLKQEQLELDAMLAKLRGAAAEADRQNGGAPSAAGDRLRAQAEQVQKAANEATRLRKEAEKFDSALVKAGGSLKDVGDASKGVTTSTTETLSKAREHARVLSEAARGALELVEAFGLMDQRTASMLRNVIQVVSNIGPLKEALSAPKQDMTSIIGAALPVVGGIAQLVSGMMGTTRDMTDAVVQLRESMSEMIDRLQDERLASSRSDAEREAASASSDFRQDVRSISDEAAAAGITRLGVVGLSPEDLRRRIDELRTQRAGSPVHGVADALEAVLKNYEQTLQDLAERQRLARAALDDELNIRRLRAAGRDDEAALEALRSQQAAEISAAEATGYYTPEQLDALRRAQEEERRALEKQQEDRRRHDEEERQRTIGDLEARRLTAEGRNVEAENARRAAEQQRELAEATDPVIKALLELAIAAEEAALAAARQAEAQRALEDLQVRLLRAGGDTAGADDLAFELAQRRELEQAMKDERSAEFIALLQQVQAAEREARRTAASGAGSGAASLGSGSSSGTAAFSQSSIQNITLTQADRITGYLATIATNTRELAMIRAALTGIRAPNLTPPVLPSSFTVGAGGQLVQNRISITLNFYGPVTGGRDAGRSIGDGILRQVNAGMGTAATLAPIAAGDVSR